MKQCLARWLPALLLIPCLFLDAAERPLVDQARQALKRGIQFFQSRVAVQGTYLWEYSADLTKREGEGVASVTRGWIQPPGTPAIGMVYLEAHDATGEQRYLNAAIETANGLMRGQLKSGGWYYHVDFDPKDRRKLAYRGSGKGRKRNTTTLDDNTTQSALRFLMRLDERLGFKNATVHESVTYALNRLHAAQYPNGAWPQVFTGPPEAGNFPVKRASFPETWPRNWPESKQYYYRYTLNDNVLADVIDMLIEAESIYGSSGRTESRALASQCRKAAEKGGGFILMAQLPQPQPIWAQQYDFDMHPSWARKFEPPAVTGGESQGVLRTLLLLYRHTSDRKYLEPIPRALAFLERSRLPDGRLARFYELKSSRPLYFTRDYKLTYDDGNMPTHYGFKVGDNTKAIRAEFEQVRKLPSDQLKPLRNPPRPTMTPDLQRQVRQIIAAQDDLGRWIEPGPLRFHRPKDPGIQVIRSRTFINNVEILSRFLKASQPSNGP